MTSVQSSTLRNPVNLDECSNITPLTQVTDGARFVMQTLQVFRGKGLEFFATSKEECVHPTQRLAQLAKTRDDLSRKPSSSSSSSSKKKAEEDTEAAAALTASIGEKMETLTATLDNDIKIYDQSAITRANMIYTIKQKVTSALLDFYTDGEDLGTTVSISEFLESVIKHTPKNTEDIEKVLEKVKIRNCGNIPQILTRILDLSKARKILNQMGKTASLDDAHMIEYLRMSITLGDSMTPSPFLKIFTSLKSTTDPTTTFKTFASNFKDALIQHGNTFGLPLYESTSTTTSMACNATTSSGKKAGTGEPPLVRAARAVAYRLRDPQYHHNFPNERYCKLCLTKDHDSYDCPVSRTLYKEAGCTRGKWTDCHNNDYVPVVSDEQGLNRS